MNPDERRCAPIDGPEADTLTGFLDRQRDTLRWKCSGLTDEQVRQPLHPTRITLAGLVLHLTMVEAGWFNLTFAGGVARPEWLSLEDPGDPDWSWTHAADFSQDQLWRWYDDAVSVSDRVVRDALALPGGLGRRAANPEEPVSLRWLLGHMIEEYARHLGHADLLRESIDGSVGD